jgi:3-oxoacyl-[acyl-carrier protein] reductase
MDFFQRNQKKTSAVSFRISEKMVQRFSDLTGDHSLLHSSDDFARKTAYRQQVVHGMLPVAFTSLLDFFHTDGFVYSLSELSGQFVDPVYIGDELILAGEIVNIDEEEALVKCNYSIEKVQTGTVVVKGAVNVRFSHIDKNEKGFSKAQTQSGFTAMITEPPNLQDFRLEDISKKDADGFPFTITEGSIDALLEILSEGYSEKDAFDPSSISNRFSFSELLSTMLFSTSVGMYIPGKYATFLKFDMKVHKSVDINVPYLFNGEVVHISGSTRIINKRISVYKSGDKKDMYLSGKVATIVNPPPVKMPNVQQLKNTSLDMGIKDQVVLITGASRGLGETTAKLFALSGAKVVVNYFRGKQDAERIVNEIVAEGGEAFEMHADVSDPLQVRADVSDPLQVRRMVQKTVEKYGTVNVLVNNAVKDFKSISFSRLTWEEIQKDINVVVKGAFNCCKEVVPLMLKQGGGKIINIGTVATDNPPANQIKYVISKSGLVGLTRSLSIEFAAKNIQINMVVPNFIETDLVAHIPDVYRKKIAQDTPMRRNAQPIDVAQAVFFLASSYSSFTTGQKIMVTGGGAPYL